jgi:hypothetical protein
MAATAGFTTAFQIGALVALGGFVLAFLVIRAKRQAAPATPELEEAA